MQSMTAFEYRLQSFGFDYCSLALNSNNLLSKFFCKKSDFGLTAVALNPIPTGLGHVTLIYGLIPPMAGRNRVK